MIQVVKSLRVFPLLSRQVLDLACDSPGWHLLEHVLHDDQGDQFPVGNKAGGPTGNRGRSAVDATGNCGAVVGAAGNRAPVAAAGSAWYVITSPDTVKKSFVKTIEQQITLKIDITENN